MGCCRGAGQSHLHGLTWFEQGVSWELLDTQGTDVPRAVHSLWGWLLERPSLGQGRAPSHGMGQHPAGGTTPWVLPVLGSSAWEA